MCLHNITIHFDKCCPVGCWCMDFREPSLDHTSYVGQLTLGNDCISHLRYNQPNRRRQDQRKLLCTCQKRKYWLETSSLVQ